MKSVTSDREENNIDLIGRKWRLGPHGKRIIERSENTLFDIQSELLGLSALVKGYAESPDHGDFFGLGIYLERLSARVKKVMERLDSALERSQTEIDQVPPEVE